MTSRLTEILRELDLLSRRLSEVEKTFFNYECTKPAYLAALARKAPYTLKTHISREEWAMAQPEMMTFFESLAASKASYHVTKRNYELKEHEFFAEMQMAKRDSITERYK